MGFLEKLFGKKLKDEAAERATPESGQDAPPPPEPVADDWEDQGVPQEFQTVEVRRRMEEEPKPVLLDVRETHEREANGHIPDDKHIPMTELPQRHHELDLSRPHIVYCASGMRSFDAGFLLIEHGCKEVINLNGGFNAWDGEKAED